MKLSKKIKVDVQEVESGFNIRGEGYFAISVTNPNLEGVLTLEANYSGKTKIDTTEHEEIIAVLGKIEKYQTGKMSEKESGKMVNKLKNHPGMESIIEKIQKNETLELEDISHIEDCKVSKTYRMDYGQLKLVEGDFVVQEAVLEELFPENEYQEELAELEARDREEYKKQQIEIARRIMGNTKEPKRKTVVQYLQEKQAKILAGEVAEFLPDIQSPLPQANDLERVLDWGQSIADSGKEKEDLEIAEADLDKRDVHYYSRAICYLGLMYVDDKYLCLTQSGDEFFKLNREAQKAMVLDILMRDDLIAKYIAQRSIDDEMVKEFSLRGLNGTTLDRRMSSMDSWLKYLGAIK